MYLSVYSHVGNVCTYCKVRAENVCTYQYTLGHGGVAYMHLSVYSGGRECMYLSVWIIYTPINLEWGHGGGQGTYAPISIEWSLEEGIYAPISIEWSIREGMYVPFSIE